MKILTTFLLLLFFASQSSAQKIIEQYISQNDSLRIGPGKNDFLPYGDKGYTLVLPDTTNNIQGVLISFEDKKFDFEFLAIPDDTHHWMKFSNGVKVSEATADFLKRKLIDKR